MFKQTKAESSTKEIAVLTKKEACNKENVIKLKRADSFTNAKGLNPVLRRWN
jgi:hypothetical protein